MSQHKRKAYLIASVLLLFGIVIVTKTYAAPQAPVTNISLPTRAAFYYPWFPETWSVNGVHVSYNPSLGYYDSSQQSAADSHIRAMDYADIKVGIASWWGPGTHNEATRLPLLLSRTAALGSSLKWALYYEKEGAGDPSVAEIQSDLDYISAHYAADNAFAKINGKPVIFVYNASAADNSCALADKWAQANAAQNFYISLKVFSGYAGCANQPATWHQYSPAVATDSQPGYSYAISPGFNRADETAPRLGRDQTRWTANIAAMKASNAPWQLVTTFNEWGEGTATESSQQWSSTSGFGTYLDALHNNPHVVTPPTTFAGDGNYDGKVDIFDLSLLLSNFGKQGTSYDFNGDGSVTSADLSILIANYGH
ncbi:MAG TPA: dockerin type I domain-containing protein, partial [Nitrosospira sp.]|nr:dockerin type I domain-containing protein [Nitrosospira sp.]